MTTRMVITNRFVKLDALLDSGSLTILYDKPLIKEIAEVLLSITALLKLVYEIRLKRNLHVVADPWSAWN